VRCAQKRFSLSSRRLCQPHRRVFGWNALLFKSVMGQEVQNLLDFFDHHR